MSLISTQSPQSQAEFVAAEIKKAIIYSKGLIQYKDIAVLMRMNFISRDFESVLRLNQIPFTMVGGDRFFDRVEVKDMTCYLSFSYNPKNITAFSRIINVPRRGIGEVWMKRILEFNRDRNENMLDSLAKIVNHPSPVNFLPIMITKLRDFLNICTHIRSMIEDKVNRVFSFCITTDLLIINKVFLETSSGYFIVYL
jgi:DNA helicase-2/ATP-dependent DNA helicase PcrA